MLIRNAIIAFVATSLVSGCAKAGNESPLKDNVAPEVAQLPTPKPIGDAGQEKKSAPKPLTDFKLSSSETNFGTFEGEKSVFEISSDGRRLLLQTGKRSYLIDGREKSHEPSPHEILEIAALAFSPSGTSYLCTVVKAHPAVGLSGAIYVNEKLIEANLNPDALRSVRFSGDGTHVAHYQQFIAGDDEWRFVVRPVNDPIKGWRVLAHKSDRPLPHTVSVSRDAKRFVYGSQNGGRFFVIDSVDSRDSQKYGPYDGLGTCEVSPRGNRLMYAAKQKNQWEIHLDGKLLTACDDLNASSTHYFPGRERDHSLIFAKKGGKLIPFRDGVADDAIDAVLGPPAFDPTTGTVFYPARRGLNFGLMRNGTFVETMGVVGRIVCSHGRVAYALADEKHSRYVIDGVAGPECANVAGGTFSPDGTQFAYVAQQGEKWRVISDVSFDGTFDAIGSPGLAFSPDGRAIAVIAEVDKRWQIIVNGKSIGRYDGFVAGCQLAFTSNTHLYAMMLTRVPSGMDVSLVDVTIGLGHDQAHTEENPYKNAAVGDFARYKLTTTAGALTLTGSLTHTVAAKSEKEVTIKVTGYYDIGGKQDEITTQEYRIDLTKPFNPTASLGLDGVDVKVVKGDSGKEKFKIGDKEYETGWTRYTLTANVMDKSIDTEVKAWNAKGIPLVKLTVVGELGGRKMGKTMEFIESGHKK